MYSKKIVSKFFSQPIHYDFIEYNCNKIESVKKTMIIVWLYKKNFRNSIFRFD